MLSEEEKAKIRAEEVYRQELRQALERGDRGPFMREKLWSLLNSSFVLWFLSSIVVTALTASYGVYQRARDDEVRRLELQRRLDTEISGRIAAAVIGLRINRERIRRGDGIEADDVYVLVVSYLDNFFVSQADNPRDFSVYPEYRRRTFRSLLHELSRITVNSELDDLHEAAKAYDRISELGNVAQGDPLKAIEDATSQLETGIMKSR